MNQGIGGERSHAIAGVFVFLLLGVFAVFSTLLVLFGAQAYRATTERTDEHSEERTLYAYLFNTVRGDDARGVVRLRSEDGVDLLAVAYDYGDGDLYEKRIYCYDGYLRELLTSADSEFDPESGEPISPASAMRMELNGPLLTMEVIDERGTTHTVETVLRSMAG